MKAGDNTLNLLCARVLLRSLVTKEHYDSADFLHEYIRFMTGPESHNDTYAESYHRDFFANWAKGIPPNRCAGAEGHDTASIGGLVGLAPVILGTAARHGVDQAVTSALTHMRLTHVSQPLEVFATAYAQLLAGLVFSPPTDMVAWLQSHASPLGKGLTALLAKAPGSAVSVSQVIGAMYSPACYIEDSFPSVLYLAARYNQDFEAALIANANAGGDNCHRGAVLGALMGAWLGFEAIPLRWRQGLVAGPAAEQEINQFINTFVSAT
jgi:ADP-ribosylglycohydrolase